MCSRGTQYSAEGQKAARALNNFSLPGSQRPMTVRSRPTDGARSLVSDTHACAASMRRRCALRPRGGETRGRQRPERRTAATCMRAEATVVRPELLQPMATAVRLPRWSVARWWWTFRRRRKSRHQLLRGRELARATHVAPERVGVAGTVDTKAGGVVLRGSRTKVGGMAIEWRSSTV